MSVPVFQQATQSQWSGAFPLNYTINANLSSCDCALVFFVTAGTYAFTPTCLVGVSVATLVDSKSTANGGTMWVWSTKSFTPGSSVSINISSASNYVDNGEGCIVGLSNTDASPIGSHNPQSATGTPATATPSISLLGSTSLVITHSFGYFTSGSLTNSAATPTATVIATNSTNSNLPSITISQTGQSIPYSVSSGWQVPFNCVTAISVEILGGSGAGASGPIGKIVFVKQSIKRASYF